MEEYSGDDIVAITSNTIACRTRPEMYVGPLAEPQAVSWLLQEALCLALASAAEGTTSEIRIARETDHSLTAWDDGSSHLDPGSEWGGRPAYESLMTRMYACREMKNAKRDFCHSGIFITNALSTWLKLDVTWKGNHWHQSYRRGEPEKEIELIGPTTKAWRQISFLPDATIFPNIELHCSTFFEWFAQQTGDLAGCKIVWLDLLNKQTRDLQSSGQDFS